MYFGLTRVWRSARTSSPASTISSLFTTIRKCLCLQFTEIAANYRSSVSVLWRVVIPFTLTSSIREPTSRDWLTRNGPPVFVKPYFFFDFFVIETSSPMPIPSLLFSLLSPLWLSVFSFLPLPSWLISCTLSRMMIRTQPTIILDNLVLNFIVLCLSCCPLSLQGPLPSKPQLKTVFTFHVDPFYVLFSQFNTTASVFIIVLGTMHFIGWWGTQTLEKCSLRLFMIISCLCTRYQI